MGITSKIRRIAESPDELIEGPPYLFVNLLLDQSSISLLTPFHLWTDELDQVTGDQVAMTGPGRPQMSGDVYKRLRTRERASRDEQDAGIYQQELQELGGGTDAENVHRLRLAKGTAQGLNVKLAMLPCLTFGTRPDIETPSTLHLKDEWYRSEPARNAFMRSLVDWLARRKYAPAVPENATVGYVHKKLKTILNQLATEIDRAVRKSSRLRPETVSRRKAKKVTPVLTLEEVANGRIWKSHCARLRGNDRFDGLDRNIGISEMLFLYLLFSSKQIEDIGNCECLVFAESDGTKTLREWHDFGCITVRGEDQHNLAARLRKMWCEFIRQMGKNENEGLRGLFITRKDDGYRGERLYGVKLRLGEGEIKIPIITDVLPEVARA
ncbi:hypothetical protein ACFLQW_04920 [Candidatus Zixiibacteriota bacterium]